MVKGAVDELTIKGPCEAHPSVTSPFSPRSKKAVRLMISRAKPKSNE